MKEKEKYNINDFWPQAEEMLNKHFRLKRIFRLLGASIFAVALIVGLFLFNRENKNLVAVNKDKNSTRKNIQSKSIVKEKSSESRFQTSDFNRNKNSETASKEIEKSQSKEADYVEQKTNEELKIEKQNNKKTNRLNSKNSENNKSTILTANTPKKSKNLKKIESNIYPENNAISIGEESLNNSTKETNKKIITKKNQETSSELNSLEERITKFDSIRLLNTKLSTPLITSYKINESIQKQELKNSFLKNKKMFWAIFAHIGYFNTSKNLNTSGDLSAYTLRRKDEEKSNFVLNYGTGIKLWYKKFALNIGVDYSSYSENVNYQNWKNGYSYNQKETWNIFYTPFTSVDTLYYQGIQYQNPNTVLVRDSTKTILTDSTYGRINNEGANQYNGKTLLSYAEFPIIAEYNFVFNKFSIGLNGGISPGIATYRNGYYISKNQETFENISTNTEFRKWIWNARAGININYKISHGLEIYLQPQYRTNLNSVFNSSSGIKQKYTSIGTSLGLLFWF